MLGSHIVKYVKTTVVITLNLSTMASLEQELGSYCAEFNTPGCRCEIADKDR